MNQHKKYAVSAAALLLAVMVLFSCNQTADTDDTAESVTTGSVTVSESESSVEPTTEQTPDTESHPAQTTEAVTEQETASVSNPESNVPAYPAVITENGRDALVGIAPAADGVYVDPLTGEVVSSTVEKEGYQRMPADGVYVIGIVNSNAKNILFPGDVIVAVNGLNVWSTDSLIETVNSYPSGEVVEVSVWRNGVKMTVEICLAEE
jgi:S1-C subfamily serine protease